MGFSLQCTVPAVVKARQEMTSQVSRSRGRAPNVAHVPMDRAPAMVFESVFNTHSAAIVIFSQSFHTSAASPVFLVFLMNFV